jgi:hypothetical protein
MMKKLALTLLFGILGVGVYGQTIKTLGFNTTNGQVVANTGTNALTFTNIYGVQVYNLTVGETSVRANFYVEDDGLAMIVYRTNAETYIGNLGFTNNSILLAVPISFLDTNTTATTRTNLGLGATNAVRFGSILLYQDGESTNSITYGVDQLFFNQNGVEFFSLDGASGGTVLFQKPISFLGTNAITNAAKTRTNLGLGGGITTNRTFVSYNGTNYTTNSVTISNGIITGWTQ